jgi:hypothetical protein
MQTSQGYIFRILQHFVTKFSNFTNLTSSLWEFTFFLPRSKISLTCKLSIVVLLVLTRSFRLLNETFQYPLYFVQNFILIKD